MTTLKYLAAYVAHTTINDERIVAVDQKNVTIRWKDRSDHNRLRTEVLPGIEFVRRYLRHVLPKGLRSIRYYGFCHPAAKNNRSRVQFYTGRPVHFGAIPATSLPPDSKRPPSCPRCGAPTFFAASFFPAWKKRGPPAPRPAHTVSAR